MITWKENVRNENVHKVLRKKENVEKFNYRRKKWVDHILRNNSYFVTLSEGKRNGIIARGRPRKQRIN